MLSKNPSENNSDIEDKIQKAREFYHRLIMYQQERKYNNEQRESLNKEERKLDEEIKNIDLKSLDQVKQEHFEEYYHTTITYINKYENLD